MKAIFEYLSATFINLGATGNATWADVAVAWSSIVVNARTEPVVAIVLLSLAVLTGLVSRQLLLLLAALLLAAFTLVSVSPQITVERVLVLSVGMIAQILLLLGAIIHRRRVNALKRRTIQLEMEKEKLQDLLNQEVLWRTAAEE